MTTESTYSQLNFKDTSSSCSKEGGSVACFPHPIHISPNNKSPIEPLLRTSNMMLKSFHQQAKSFLNPQQDRFKPPNRVLKMGHEASHLASARSKPQCMTEMNTPPFYYSEHPKTDTNPPPPRVSSQTQKLSPLSAQNNGGNKMRPFHIPLHHITSQHIPKIHSSWHVTSHSKPHRINQYPQKPKTPNTPYQLRLPHASVHHSNPNPYPPNRDLFQALNNLYNPNSTKLSNNITLLLAPTSHQTSLPQTPRLGKPNSKTLPYLNL